VAKRKQAQIWDARREPRGSLRRRGHQKGRIVATCSGGKNERRECGDPDAADGGQHLDGAVGSGERFMKGELPKEGAGGAFIACMEI